MSDSPIPPPSGVEGAAPSPLAPTTAKAPRTRTERAFLALASSVGFLVVGMLASFVATPLLIRALGSERFGVSRALLDAFGYVALLEFGLVGASRPVIVAAVARGDTEVLAHTMRTIVRSFLWPILLKTLASAALVLLVPIVIKVPETLRREAMLAAAIAVLGVLTTPAPIFQHLLAAQQREYRNSLIQGIQNLSTIVLAVVAAHLGYGLMGQSGVTVAAGVAATVALFALAAPHLRASRARPDLVDETRRALRRLNLTTFLRSACSRVAISSDRLFIASMLSASMVTGFHVSVRLVDVAAPFLYSIGNASWPALADMKLRGQHDLFEARLRETSMIVVTLGGLLLAPVIVVSEAFVARWVGSGIFVGHVVICLAALNAVLLALISFWDYCIGTVGDARALLLPSLVAAFVNVGVTVFATRWGGPVGPVLGTAAGMGGVMLGWDAWLLSRDLRVSAFALLASVLRVMVGAAVYTGISLTFVAPLCQPSWPSIALVGCAVAIGWLLLAWTALLNSATRSALRQRALHLVRRFKPV